MNDSGRVLAQRVCLRATMSLCLGGLAVTFTGCRTKATTVSVPVSTVWEARPAAGAPDSLDSIARGYVRVALALGERDPDSIDFSVAPAEVAAAIHTAYPAYDEIATEVAGLQDRLDKLGRQSDPEHSARIEFLKLQLAAIDTRIGMERGRILDFDSEAKALFATTRRPDTEAEAAHRRSIRAQVLSHLPPARVRGKDAEQYGAFDQRYLVPRDKLQAVMTAALAACRTRTLEHLKLPAGEAVDLTFVHNQPWSAFSRYRGHAHSTISLNLDFPLSVDEVLELACHEGYPGHHTFNTLRDEALLRQKEWPEMQVQLTFTPQSYLSEAAAAYAPRLAFSPAERAQVEREVLFPLAGLPPAEADRYVEISNLVRELDSAEPAIARDYLDGRLEFVRADTALEEALLMAHPDASLMYLNEYRSYMLAYTDGPRRIAAALPAPSSSVEARWTAYEDLMLHLRRLPE